jgi:hypothetical protein
LPALDAARDLDWAVVDGLLTVVEELLLDSISKDQRILEIGKIGSALRWLWLKRRDHKE